MNVIQLGAAMDGDGHFRLAHILDKPKMINLLKSIHDGDYWENSKDKIDESEDINTMTEDRWLSFLWAFTQRGTFEIIDLEFKL